MIDLYKKYLPASFGMVLSILSVLFLTEYVDYIDFSDFGGIFDEWPFLVVGIVFGLIGVPMFLHGIGKFPE